MLPGTMPYVGFTGSGRFTFESVDLGAGTSVTRGSTHRTGENLAYLGIGATSSSGSVSSTGFTWDGAASEVFVGAVSNLNSEGKANGFGLWNVYDTDYDKTVALTGSGSNKTYVYLRLIGGYGPVTYVTHSARGNNPGFSVTHNFTVQKNDIIISSCAQRNGSNFAASNLDLVLAPNGERRTYAKIMTTSGAFSTTLTSSGQSQQWVDITMQLRPQV
jgi:hypothetical protein